MHESAFAERPSGADEQLARCEERIGYYFQDREMLRGALTHASGADNRLASNERLEFLGDAILGFVVCELLYEQFPSLLEGDLTKIKSVVVSRKTCAKISRALGLIDFLIVGKGMATSAAVPPSLLADVFESLVAAIHLDGGLEASKRFILTHVALEIDLAASGESGANYKSQLQQHAQRECGTTPTYVLLDEKGPDHSKSFEVAAQVGTLLYPPAWGRNKREAEQRSAANALAVLRDETPPFAIE
jgi:ribonuclease-3